MPCFNYADDTRMLCIHKDYACSYNDLLSTASAMIHWYKVNFLHANPEKFQFIFLVKYRQPRYLHVNNNVIIQSVPYFKLLGITIDVDLNFSNHIALLCRKTGR